MGPARTYPWRKMRRSRAPSIAPGTFFVAQSWADCITNMAGFNLRQAQEWRHVGGHHGCDAQGFDRRASLAGIEGQDGSVIALAAVDGLPCAMSRASTGECQSARFNSLNPRLLELK